MGDTVPKEIATLKAMKLFAAGINPDGSVSSDPTELAFYAISLRFPVVSQYLSLLDAAVNQARPRAYLLADGHLEEPIEHKIGRFGCPAWSQTGMATKGI